jgi:hypothetical protein
LDGGGAKGFYTLGVLKQIEAMAGPLHERFDLVFGTSTGSIIAALICLGRPVDEILTLYREHVVKVMREFTPCAKTAALEALQKEIFLGCQSALDWDPLSASKRDPFERRVRPVALAPSELAGVAETVRARVVGSSSRLLKRQESLPVSTMSQ